MGNGIIVFCWAVGQAHQLTLGQRSATDAVFPLASLLNQLLVVGARYLAPASLPPTFLPLGTDWEDSKL